MSPALIEQPFVVDNIGSLQIGRAITLQVKDGNGPTMLKGKGWAMPAGAYTPRQIVEANAPLLEVVLHHLGPNQPNEPSTREMLLDNLASNLALGTRESSITIPARDASRAEMAKQAVKIGKKLIEYAFNVTGMDYDPNYVVRSPCEGHLLKPHISGLMFGPRSLRHLMQIYNEYLHQMVLLRDALLPFDNFEEVIIPIDAEPGRKRGMRHTEDTRAAFLMEMTTKSIKQSSIIKAAQFLLAPELSNDNACGFQYKHGVLLPSFAVGGNSARLLRFVPAILDESDEQVVFQYELRDYYTAARAKIADHAKAASDSALQKDKSQILQAELLSVTANGSSVRNIQLCIHTESDGAVKIDLGQIARGRRYAQLLPDVESSSNEKITAQVKAHSALEVLTKSDPGLIVAPKDEIHLIQASSNVELLATLGRLYPDNVVVMKQGQSLEQAVQAGKDGLPDAGRFVIEVAGDYESIAFA